MTAGLRRYLACLQDQIDSVTFAATCRVMLVEGWAAIERQGRLLTIERVARRSCDTQLDRLSQLKDDQLVLLEVLEASDDPKLEGCGTGASRQVSSGPQLPSGKLN